jgi:hypothetical protein
MALIGLLILIHGEGLPGRPRAAVNAAPANPDPATTDAAGAAPADIADISSGGIIGH